MLEKLFRVGEAINKRTGALQGKKGKGLGTTSIDFETVLNLQVLLLVFHPARTEYG